MNAYLIIAHNDPENLNRIVKNLLNNENTFIVHLDLKTNLNEFKSNLESSVLSKIEFIEDRTEVFWGDFSMVDAMLKLMKYAVNSGEIFDHLIFLSGNDYPIKSAKKISDFFNEYKGEEIIRAYNLSDNGCRHCQSKIKNYWFFDNNKSSSMVGKILMKSRILLFSPLKKGRFVKINGEKKPVYYGSQWFAITQECAKYIVCFYEKNPNFKKYFKHSFAPDEMFFHTIIFNSTFASKTFKGIDRYNSEWSLNNYTYLNSIDLNCKNQSQNQTLNFLFRKRKKNSGQGSYQGSIAFYDETEYRNIINSKFLFVRKVKSEYSNNLIKLIDKKNSF